MAAWRSDGGRATFIWLLSGAAADVGELLSGARRAAPTDAAEEILLNMDGSLFVTPREQKPVEFDTARRTYLMTPDDLSEPWDHGFSFGPSPALALLVVNARDGVSLNLRETLVRARFMGTTRVVASVLASSWDEPRVDELVEAEVADALRRAGFAESQVLIRRADFRDERSVSNVFDAIDLSADALEEDSERDLVMVVDGVEPRIDRVRVLGISDRDAVHSGMVLEAFFSDVRRTVSVTSVQWVGEEQEDLRGMVALELFGIDAASITPGAILAHPGTFRYMRAFEANMHIVPRPLLGPLELSSLAGSARVRLAGEVVDATIDAVEVGVADGDAMVTVTLSEPAAMRSNDVFTVEIGRDLVAFGAVAQPLASVDDDAKLVTVWYGTNRVPQHSGLIPAYGGGSNDGRIHYGACTVRIPRSHRFGTVSTGWWKKMWQPAKWGSDLTLNEVRPADSRDDIAAQIRAALDTDEPEKRAVVYLHGYNTTFEDAALRAAQLDADLNIPGITSFFSWPSHAEFLGYLADKERAQESLFYFLEFLRMLHDQAEVDRIDLIVHSMGNQIFTDALTFLVADAHNSGIPLGAVIMAAPDVSTNLFTRKTAGLGAHAGNATMYVSAKDLALKVAQKLQQGPRAGACPPVTVVNGIDTIETTDADLSLLGHGYYGAAHAILYDMRDIMNGMHDPTRRARLHPAYTQDNSRYWQFSR